MRHRSRSVVAVTLALLAGALLAGPRSQAAAELSLPQLSLEQVLDVARVPLPADGTMLQIHADFPEENPLVIGDLPVYALTLDVDPQGNVMTRSAVSGSGGGETLGECKDPSFSPLGVMWASEDIPVPWRLNARSIPDGISEFKTLRSIRKAHQVWPRVQTRCSDADDNAFHFDFSGLTRKHIKADGVNTIDFGSLGGGALAVSYTWYKGTRILEVDLRLNKADYRWTNRLDSKHRYNIWNVATHELGHQLGLDDLGDAHRDLTMFGRISKGELRKVTLGRGDLKGARAVSP